MGNERNTRRRAPLGRLARASRRTERGVGLVEFALILPVFLAITLAMIEFGFALNAVLAINRASQAGALLAGQAGNDASADCVILRRIEENLVPPLNKRDLQEVRISRTNNTGKLDLASNVYQRSGSKNCGSYTVPYTASSSGYPEAQRCNVSAGCATLSPPRSTVDKVSVQIAYRNAPVTPLSSLLRVFQFGGNGDLGIDWTFSQRNVSRMEPVQ